MNPVNVTVCMGSSANFTCVINGTGTVDWLINGVNSSTFGSQITNVPSLAGEQLESTLTLPPNQLSNGLGIVCQYSYPHQVVRSSVAFLFLQG